MTEARTNATDYALRVRPEAVAPEWWAAAQAVLAIHWASRLSGWDDNVSPIARAPAVGVYRFWHDTDYVAGGLIAGTVADALGFGGAIGVVAALTAASGIRVEIDLPGRHAARVGRISDAAT